MTDAELTALWRAHVMGWEPVEDGLMWDVGKGICIGRDVPPEDISLIGFSPL